LGFSVGVNVRTVETTGVFFRAMKWLSLMSNLAAVAWLLNVPFTEASLIAEDPSCSAVRRNHIGSRSPQQREASQHDKQISQTLFDDLQELARLVDISYCVGSTGLREPFECLNHCKEFEGFELVTVSAMDSPEDIEDDFA
jgi:hypothetical protein